MKLFCITALCALSLSPLCQSTGINPGGPYNDGHGQNGGHPQLSCQYCENGQPPPPPPPYGQPSSNYEPGTANYGPGSGPIKEYDGHGQGEGPIDGHQGQGGAVCASSTDYFASQCWLDLYNKVYKTNLTPASNDSVCSGLTGPFFGCPCSALCAFIYNPLCIHNKDTGEEVTVANYCLYKCGNGCTFSRQIKHCGPCVSDNSTSGFPIGECQGDGQLNCLPTEEPQLPCTPPGQPPFQSKCERPCTKEFFPVCGWNQRTGVMHTFSNQCLVNCEIAFDSDWKSLGGHGECPCRENSEGAMTQA